VVEAQMMSMKLHSAWMGVDVKTIYATGGASANRAILQVMADVFNAPVYQLVAGNTAALGAALRAFHADANHVGWNEVVRRIAEPVAASLVRPDAEYHETYKKMMAGYVARERESLL